MTDLVYTFPFTRHAAGRAVSVLTEDGTVVNTGTVTSTPDESLAYVYSATLPEDVYTGVVTSATGNTLHAQGKFDIPATIAAAGGGAVETAHFIGTTTGDTSGDQFALTFAQDPDQPAVDWASVVDGQIVLPGPVVIAMMYRYVGTLDFTVAAGFSTAMTSPDTDATIEASRVPGTGDGWPVKAGGPYYAIPVGTPGLVFDFDAVERGLTEYTRAAANNEMTIRGTVNAFGYDADGAPVTDGVLTAALAVWITRATLPPAPALP